MKLPLTEQRLEEARRFELRSAGPTRAGSAGRSTRPARTGERPDPVAFCEELELR